MSLTTSLLVTDDLHSHLLPGRDDGAETVEHALAVARRAAGVGIRRMIATPHVDVTAQDSPHSARSVPGAVADLQAAIARAGIDLEVVPGAEVTLSGDLLERLPAEPWLTLGGLGRHLLMMVHVPLRRWPSFVDELIFRITLLQVTPIICHPERTYAVQQDPHVLRGPVGRGALIQITAGSLLRTAPPRLRRCAYRLLREGLVSFVASDAHGPDDPFPSEVVEAVIGAVGEDEARRILVDNPGRVFAGREVAAPAVRPPRRRLAWLRRPPAKLTRQETTSPL